MRIGFFGTPDIAAYCLQRLIDAFEVAFVVTNDDKPCGRCLAVKCSPVKQLALDHGIRVYQPLKLKDEQFIRDITAEAADLFVVVAYGGIIPAAVYTLPPKKTINLHPSLLPRYRGPAPIPWVLIDGESETGVTIQHINNRVDSGDILSQERIPLSNDMTAGDLYDIVLPRGSALLVETIRRIGTGDIEPRVQDEAAANYCVKFTNDNTRIDWKSPAQTIHNLVRGLNPEPVAWTTFRGRHMKIWKTRLFDTDPFPAGTAPGSITTHQKKRMLVAAAGGALEILELQPETKKRMDAASFVNGCRLAAGERFD